MWNYTSQRGLCWFPKVLQNFRMPCMCLSVSFADWWHCRMQGLGGWVSIQWAFGVLKSEVADQQVAIQHNKFLKARNLRRKLSKNLLLEVHGLDTSSSSKHLLTQWCTVIIRWHWSMFYVSIFNLSIIILICIYIYTLYFHRIIHTSYAGI